MEDDFRELYAARAAAPRRTAYLLCGDWHHAEDLVQVSVAELPDAPAHVAPGVEDRELLKAALLRVSPRQRACLVLRFFEDLTVAETARVLGRQRQHRQEPDVAWSRQPARRPADQGAAVNVTDGLRDLVSDEPPFVLRPDAAIAAGRRQRRVRGVALTATGAAVAAGAFALLAPGGSAPTTVRFADGPPSQDTGDTTSAYYQVARAHTPADWTIRDGATEQDSGWWANVSDGVHGPGRLGLWRSTRGGLQQHPCSDSEFVAKATSCTETMLDAHRRLIVRTVSHTDPINDIQVVIVHSDGSGVNVSDDNATWPDIPAGTVFRSGEEKRERTRGTVGSPEPLYSTDQLVAMAKALDG
jgi:hypothetical protein